MAFAVLLVFPPQARLLVQSLIYNHRKKNLEIIPVIIFVSTRLWSIMFFRDRRLLLHTKESAQSDIDKGRSDCDNPGKWHKVKQGDKLMASA